MRVLNFDQLSDYERRQHKLNDIPLGKRGVPIRGMAYFCVIAGVNAVVVSMSGLGALITTVGGVNVILLLVGIYVGLPFGLAYVAVMQMPGGLPAHALIAPALAYLVAPKSLFGWVPIREVNSTWRPPDLVVEADIADADAPTMRLSGPADLYVANEYSLEPPVGLLARLRGGPARTVLTIYSKARSTPRGISIPESESIEIRRAD